MYDQHRLIEIPNAPTSDCSIYDKMFYTRKSKISKENINTWAGHLTSSYILNTSF